MDRHPNRLEDAAREAWELAFAYRHETNWGRAVSASIQSAALLRAGHPRIRRLAADLHPTKPKDICA